jgi:gliding motility-associated lipoprotein GldK
VSTYLKLNLNLKENSGVTMKRTINFLLLVVSVFILSACGGSRETGDLTGVLNRPEWRGINPYGMVYIPSGTFTIGVGDQDVMNTFVQRPKEVSIQGFYMDETEITNNEYRQFTKWVIDSIAHVRLEHWMEDAETPDGAEHPPIDWSFPIYWGDEENIDLLDDMYYQGDDRIDGKKELDTRKLDYTYYWYDWERAARNSDPRKARTDFVETKTVNVYPDTLVWVRDFAYSYNEPMARNYFSHPAYDDYPVVGVDWHQANAFSQWRTNLWNKYNAGQKGVYQSEDYRLPSEHEWEYAARGGKDMAPYPWGGYYVRNGKGCLIANFKPGRGNYPEDGGFYTVKADAYFPNDYGLYNMAGNVSEWTSSAYYENAYSFLSDLNPTITQRADDNANKIDKRKVVRGGSWKDVYYFLQTGTRDFEYQDTTKAHIGFRNVLTFMGRSINDF